MASKRTTTPAARSRSKSSSEPVTAPAETIEATPTSDADLAGFYNAASEPPRDAKIQSLEEALAARIAQRDELEAHEHQRATASCASLVIEIVGCRWATPINADKKVIPDWVFAGDRKCHLGKTRPDNECRNCAFHTLLRYGTAHKTYTRRYHDHGMVIPLPNEQVANELSDWLEAHPAGLKPMRAVDQEIEYIHRAILVRKRQIEDEAREAIERQQGKRR